MQTPDERWTTVSMTITTANLHNTTANICSDSMRIALLSHCNNIRTERLVLEKQVAAAQIGIYMHIVLCRLRNRGSPGHVQQTNIDIDSDQQQVTGCHFIHSVEA